MTVDLIKGYHALHIIFPRSLDDDISSTAYDSDEEKHNNDDDDESSMMDGNTNTASKKIHTYMYFKPHQVSHSSLQTSSSSSSSHRVSQDKNDNILFVTNVPMIPRIQSSLLLEYIFGQFAQVDHVIIVPSPRRNQSTTTNLHSIDNPTLNNEVGISFSNLNNKSYLDIQGEFYHPGKYAHVYFHSSKDRKRALQHVTRLSKGILHLDSDSSILDLKELSNKSFCQFQQFISKYSNTDTTQTDTHTSLTTKINYLQLQNEDYIIEDEDDDDVQEGKKKGIQALVRWHQRSIPCRTLLQQKCDDIIMEYEEKEHQLQQSQQKEKLGVPDEDGFITVSYKSMTSSLRGVQSSDSNNNNAVLVEASDNIYPAIMTSSSSSSNARRRASSSSRGLPKKERKIVRGSEPLPDFYKFQSRESRKRNADDLKMKFQQDLQRVKKMKEDKEYRPF